MFIVSHNLRRAQFWNRFFGWAVSIPFGVPYDSHWEKGHQIHHLHPVEPQDPQTCPARAESGWPLVKWIAKTLFIPGGTVVVEFDCPTARVYAFNVKVFLAQALFWGVYGFLVIHYVHWTALIAAVIGFKVGQVLNVIKIVMEHGGDYGKQVDPFLRSCSSFFPLRWLFMPLNISLHFEHHLHYCVPWYDLMKYHRELMKLVPQELHHIYWHRNGEIWSQLKGQIILPATSAG